MIKTTGKEFKAFMADEGYWPEGWFMDDIEVTFDGSPDDSSTQYEDLLDTCEVAIVSGSIYKGDYGGDVISLESFFKKWKKLQTVEYVTVEIPKGKSDELKAFVKTLK